MGHFVFTTTLPKCWQEICDEQGNLFSSLEWQTMLAKSFSTTTLYGWNAQNETGITITVFKAGPFRIGYVGFPVGGILGKQPIDGEMIAVLRKTHFPNALHLLRLPASAFHNTVKIDLESVTTPETAIVNLQTWELSKIPKIKNRNVRKANRAGLKVIDASLNSSTGDILYDLYRNTVQRNYGNLRYNLKYFKMLVELSGAQQKLRCILALIDGSIAGFIVVALHGKTAYYLHGAMDFSLKKYAASDRLMYEAIVWAKENEMTCFNLMASPIDQPFLIRYKEKWGGITKDQKVYEMPIKPLCAKAFKGSMLVYNSLNKLLS